MAGSGLWLRTAVRTLRQQDIGVRLTAGATAIVLVAGVAALGGRGLSDDGGGTRDLATGATTPSDARPVPGAPGGSVITVPEPGSTTTIARGTASSVSGTASKPGSPTTQGPLPKGSSPAVTPDPTRTLTASDRGVTPTTVKVVFPWFDIAAYTSASGTTTDQPLESGPDAINAFVDYVNANGGLDGRLIEAQIESFNPLNESDMRARCRRWTEDDKVFAVVDSQAWHSDHQLCITQDHDTPLVTNLGLTEEWTKRGTPYLWWTSPTSEETIDDWVRWAAESGQIDRKSTIGVVTGVKEEEKLGRAEIERALKAAGLFDRATFEEIPGYTADIALANAAIPGAVSRMKRAGVDRLFMGLSALVFTVWMEHADAQEFTPRYLLSDFNNTITVAEALLADSHPDSLQGAIGPTYIRLGEKSVKDADGVFTPSEALCNEIWQKANPSAEAMDRAGIAARWCDNIFVFAEAARRASRANRGVLTRKNWAQAMATIRGFGSAMGAELSWSSGDYSGITQTRIVSVVTSNEAYCKAQGDPDDNCYRVIAPYGAMRRL